MDALLREVYFIVAYCAFAAVLHGVVYAMVRLCADSCKHPFIVSFELMSLIQFLLWLPFAFEYWFPLPGILETIPIGVWGIVNLINARELYDVIVLHAVRKKYPAYRKYINAHHAYSTATRLVFMLLAYLFFDSDTTLIVFSVILIYYCCSVFIVGAMPTESLVLRGASRKIKYWNKLVYFVLARVTHGLSVLFAAVVFAGMIDEFAFKVLLLLVLAFGYYFNEKKTVKSEYSRLRAYNYYQSMQRA